MRWRQKQRPGVATDCLRVSADAIGCAGLPWLPPATRLVGCSSLSWLLRSATFWRRPAGLSAAANLCSLTLFA